ncbi:glycosyl transferase [Acrocarpospora corrugata]|uniref:Glycosyl transferase n=1 Tax=Acrocarpospora corrugata TaxID=35763 RepID=A0A5M3VW38_9ACTN|nr:glycosyltransferase [Acrocarpospora corrugata]GER99312.1 glycosyl transferase [Acrocarpospora corrugata]
MSSATPGFAHLIRLSDDTGLFEHARHAVVRREHGYCTDDVARGLVVVCREPRPSHRLTRLAESYLGFLTHAQGPSGAFRNRLTFDRRWRDEPGAGDWWGRALWGLGTAAGRHSAPWIRDEALTAFTLGAEQRSPHRRAMAFAGLGAAEVLRASPDSGVAATLLTDAVAAIGALPEDPSWPWPEPYLSYANAALAEVLISAGDLSDDRQVLNTGLQMLTWLCDIQTKNGRLSVVPATGWRPGEPRAQFDQQPIEVAALADACAVASLVTGDPSWQQGVRRAVSWFQGANDASALMWDPATGGGFDGLTEQGPNLNQGAESTLALISTMQHARELS